MNSDTGLVQINLQIQWPLNRINILDVLKPTEDEIAKYYKQLESEQENSNDDVFSGSSVEGSSDKSQNKNSAKSEPCGSTDDPDRDEQSSSLKRNQKPSKLAF